MRRSRMVISCTLSEPKAPLIGWYKYIGTCKECGAPLYTLITFGSGCYYKDDLCGRCRERINLERKAAGLPPLDLGDLVHLDYCKRPALLDEHKREIIVKNK